MSEFCPSCGSCGFPMESPSDFAGGNPQSLYCSTCGQADGTLKAYTEAVEANAEYLVRLQKIDLAAARLMADALLSSMPAWKGR